MKLSILICTLPERKAYLARLLGILSPQVIQGKVEVLTDDTPRGVITTGQKRNNLLNRAKGKYIVFIDDDDMVPGHYVNRIA